ncbi:MAG: Fic family protein [Bacteroidales bacterium]
MSTRFRNNLTGASFYKSYIPPKVSEYELIDYTDRISKLSELFNKLNRELTIAPQESVMKLIRKESYDSWRLADDKVANLFSFFYTQTDENGDNIIRATEYAFNAMEELPISTRLIRNTHYIICEGPDYDKKYRGEYRQSPIWIGKAGSSLNNALFVPPVGNDMSDAIIDLENYINYSEDNIFVKAAITHYQFEMIHPFIDGNGRVGRLINNLLLVENNVLPHPALLLSQTISNSHKLYYDSIQYANETGDISRWVAYWMDCLIDSGEYTLNYLISNH